MAHIEAPTAPERIELGDAAWPIYSAAIIIGLVGICLAVALGYWADSTLRRFFFSYLVAFCYVLSLAIGSLFFVLLQHVTKAGWSVSVRRIGEWMAASMPVVAAMSAPILVVVLMHNGTPYKWSDPNWGKPEAAETKTAVDNTKTTEEPIVVSPSKRWYLSPIPFVTRIAIYFAIWSCIGIWYWKQSTLQDQDGDAGHTAMMQRYAAPALVVCAITTTLAAFDLIMSLDPSWTSTIFGVYFFAGGMMTFFATAIIIATLLQRRGYLTRGITVEHFHDLGKFLFAFTFFFGYIGFSQFMLIWYGNLPEEVEWYRRRGASTSVTAPHFFTPFILAILFGKVLIPFAGLLSRHVKRNPRPLFFWACWILFFQWCDMYWLVMPELDGYVHWHTLVILQPFLMLGLLGIFFAVVARKAAHGALRPLHDPRMSEALAFQNI